MSALKITILVAVVAIAAAVVVFATGSNQLTLSKANSSACPAMADDAGCTHKSVGSGTQTAAAATAAVASSTAMDGTGCTKPCPKTACKGKTSDARASLAPIEGHEGSRMVLTGRYVCGYCDLGVSDKCQAAFQTASGENYLLVPNNLSKELRGMARDTDVEIVTHVKKYDGVKYLEVDAVKAI